MNIMGNMDDASSSGDNRGARNSSRSIVFPIFGDRENVRGKGGNLAEFEGHTVKENERGEDD